MIFANSNDLITAGAVQQLQIGAYGMIVADPPWRFENWSRKGIGKGAARHYYCMRTEAIAALPVQLLAAPDACLFLWATWPMIFHAAEVMKAWGFTYKTGGCWHKTTSRGNPAFGPGYRVRSACEPFLLGYRGNPKHSKSHRNSITAAAREHSRKPESAYDWAMTYMPDVRRCDLFSRTLRIGWETWGNELCF